LFAEVRLTLVDPEIEPTEAVMLLKPGLTPFSIPVLLIVASGAEDAQLDIAVTSPIDPSLYAPVAVNCCVCPTPKVGADGYTVIAVRVLALSVSGSDAVFEGSAVLIASILTWDELGSPEGAV
jgi:hypothetical protein